MGGNSSKTNKAETPKKFSPIIYDSSHKHYTLTSKSIAKIDSQSLGDLRVFPTEVFAEIAKFISFYNVARLSQGSQNTSERTYLLLVSKGIFQLCNHNYIWKYYFDTETWHSGDLCDRQFCCYKKWFISRFTNPTEKSNRRKAKIQELRLQYQSVRTRCICNTKCQDAKIEGCRNRYRK
jgi:hypothetical protein